MKIKIILLTILLICTHSFSVVNGNQKFSIYYYTYNTDGYRNLYRKQFSYTDESKNGLVENVLKKLIDEPIDEFIYILEHTKVLNFAIIGNELFINLNREAKKENKSSYENMAIKDQYLKTLLELNFINKVTFYVNGKISYVGSGVIIERDNNGE